ncbi:MAG: DMT family transporter [Betaproteobacteria bacterium]|jgi:drug/metabolite transporter (DMT)-like permease|nr:DMT family transporter [Rubrivivax sp.]
MSFAARVDARGWVRVLLWVVPLLWSSNYVIARVADGLVAPHALAAGRWLLAGIVLLAFVWRPLREHRAALRREWWHLLALGFLGMYICGAWVYEAGRSTSSANMALIYAVTPMTIAAASAWALGEAISRRQWLGMALALAGLLFIITKGDPARLLSVQFVAGDLWITACAASWTAYSVLLKRWPSALPPLVRLVAVIGGGLVVLLPGALLEALLRPTPPWSWAAAGLVATAALVPGVLSYGAHSLLQRELGASRTAMMLYLAPVYGAGLAWLLLGEVPGWYHAVGAAMILPSIWMASRR